MPVVGEGGGGPGEEGGENFNAMTGDAEEIDEDEDEKEEVEVEKADAEDFEGDDGDLPAAAPRAIVGGRTDEEEDSPAPSADAV